MCVSTAAAKYQVALSAICREAKLMANVAAGVWWCLLSFKLLSGRTGALELR